MWQHGVCPACGQALLMLFNTPWKYKFSSLISIFRSLGSTFLVSPVVLIFNPFSSWLLLAPFLKPQSGAEIDILSNLISTFMIFLIIGLLIIFLILGTSADKSKGEGSPASTTNSDYEVLLSDRLKLAPNRLKRNSVCPGKRRLNLWLIWMISFFSTEWNPLTTLTSVVHLLIQCPLVMKT